MKIGINGYIVPDEYKEAYEWYGYPAFCPNDIKLAKKAAASEALEITIGTCYGGSIFAGSEIGTEIKGHPGGAEIEITGLAASAASVIAMFAKCRMSPTAMLMVHNVSSAAEGDWRVFAKEADTLKECNKAMSAAYVMKSGMSEAEALKMMNDESWLNAAKAKSLGLIDEIMFENDDPSQLVAALGPGMLPRAAIDKAMKMIAEKKAEQETADKTAQEQRDTDLTIARAKLNLIEKMI